MTIKMKCETCLAELAAIEPTEDRHVLAARAKSAGIWVKNFLIFGDESGYHYFCGKECGNKFKETIIP